jgi:hypothetical protein
VRLSIGPDETGPRFNYSLSSVMPQLPVAAHLVPQPHRPAGVAQQLHVADRNRGLLLGDAALDLLLRIGAHVLLHDADVLDQHLAGRRHHAQNSSLLALVASGDHFHRVVTADINGCHRFLSNPFSFGRPYAA